MSLIRLTEVRGDLRTEDCDVWINPWGVNSVRAATTDALTFLKMDDGEQLTVRANVELVVEALNFVLASPRP